MELQEKEKYIDSLYRRNYFGRQVLDEVQNLYPQIIKCYYADSYQFYDTLSNPDKLEILVFTTKDKKLANSDKQKIENWLKARLKSDRIKVYFE